MRLARTAPVLVATLLVTVMTDPASKACPRIPSPAEMATRVQRALEEADSLLDMFAAVLKLARVESNPNWRLERVDATEAIRELIVHGPPERWRPLSELAWSTPRSTRTG